MWPWEVADFIYKMEQRIDHKLDLIISLLKTKTNLSPADQQKLDEIFARATASRQQMQAVLNENKLNTNHKGEE